MFKWAIVIACLLPATAWSSPASQYFYMRDGDTLHIARQDISAAYREIYPEKKKARRMPDAAERAEWRRKLEASVVTIAKQVGIDPILLDAMILVESGYNPRAVSKKGAQGLLQIMPETALMIGLSEPFDAHKNVAAGAQYFADLLTEFKDLKLAIAAYNAGPEAVRRAQGIPEYPETIRHVQTVMALYERAKKQ